jgi:hypothetical protein
MAKMARAAPNDPEDPAYWLAKADEARAIAEEMEFRESRSSMLWVARAYAIVAEWIESRRNQNDPGRRPADPRFDPRRSGEPARKGQAR